MRPPSLFVQSPRAFRVTAGGFFQANLPQAEALIDLVLARLALQGNESVLELYSGVGLFTAFLAERASMVTAIESYPPAVAYRQRTGRGQRAGCPSARGLGAGHGFWKSQNQGRTTAGF